MYPPSLPHGGHLLLPSHLHLRTCSLSAILVAQLVREGRGEEGGVEVGRRGGRVWRREGGVWRWERGEGVEVGEGREGMGEMGESGGRGVKEEGGFGCGREERELGRREGRE